jgi:autoinducer 2-degrading protein
MFTLFVKFTVDPQGRDTLMNAFIEDGKESLNNEPGTLRFDVIEDSSNPNVFFLYEIYNDETAFSEHTKGEPYQKFIKTLHELLTNQQCQVEEITRGTSLFPPNDSQGWKKHDLT